MNVSFVGRSVDREVAELGTWRREVVVRMYVDFVNQGARDERVLWIVLRGASRGVVKAMVWPRRPLMVTVMGEVEFELEAEGLVVSSMMSGLSLARGGFRCVWCCSRTV